MGTAHLLSLPAVPGDPVGVAGHSRAPQGMGVCPMLRVGPMVYRDAQLNPWAYTRQGALGSEVAASGIRLPPEHHGRRLRPPGRRCCLVVRGVRV